MKNTLFFLLTTASLAADIQVAVQELPNTDTNMEKVSSQKENQQQTSPWLSCVKERSAANESRKFTAKDKFGKPVILEWKKTDIQSPDLAAFKKNVCDLACQALAPIEVQFLQAYPHAVSQEIFLKPCASFFEKGVDAVDWELVKEKIQSTIRQFYLTDLSTFGAAVIKPLLDDVYFLVTVKDREGEKLLGFTMLAITPALPFGNVKLINIAIIPEEKDRGLEQLLMSSIFNIIPQVNRIFLGTRPTNDRAIEMYRSWGFTQDLNPVQDPKHKINTEYLIVLEYKADQSSILQKSAEALVAE